MTHYISTTTKKLVGRNNQACGNPLVIDYDTLFDLDFSFVNTKNQLEDLTDLSGLYIAGGLVDKNDTIGEIIFLCEDYEISGNILTFKGIDTYTEEFLNGVTKKYQPINIEIGQITDNQKQVLLRDQCLASPRVRIIGFDPTDIQDYYTKAEVDGLISSTLDEVVSEVSGIAGMTSQPIIALSGSQVTIEPSKIYSLSATEDTDVLVQMQGTTLRQVGNYSDTIDWMTGIVTRNIKTFTLNGTEEWKTYSSGTGPNSWVGFVVADFLPEAYARAPYTVDSDLIISLPNGGTSETRIQLWLGVGGSTSIFVAWHREVEAPSSWYDPDTDTRNLDGFKAWLTTNPLTVQYVSSAPTTEQIQDWHPTYAESILFIDPGYNTITFPPYAKLDVDLTNASTYRLLFSWTPVGLVIEQTGEWLNDNI